MNHDDERPGARVECSTEAGFFSFALAAGLRVVAVVVPRPLGVAGFVVAGFGGAGFGAGFFSCAATSVICAPSMAAAAIIVIERTCLM
jgi:hypothetical protein